MKTHTGLKNKSIVELFGVSISAVTKAVSRIDIQRKANKSLITKIERIVLSIFKV